ncbi:hypothetical protein [Nonomuraea sp. B5E05]|uniref:hypothetical protein n=1 Tax=Nonomuraea sp. B5E05 TaxID=3153569 RepID=UPI00326150B9
MRHITRAALTALTLTATFASAPPAIAAAPAGNAPSCVAVWQTTGTFTKKGYARNDCDRRLRLKIKWARGTDGACHTVDPGHTIYSQVARGPRTFDGADTC